MCYRKKENQRYTQFGLMTDFGKNTRSVNGG